MADTQGKDRFEESAADDFSQASAKGKKKKSKKRGCGFFILMLLLAAGAAAGVQASGAVDLRPFVFYLLPRLPKVGQDLANAVGIPAEYSLTSAERRRMENDEFEKMLAGLSRSLDARQKALDKVSKDLSVKEDDLVYAQEELAAKLESLSEDIAAAEGDMPSEALENEISKIISTFEQMSVRNAAEIIEKLNKKLAVAVLDGLPEDVRANALGRMDATIAAGLTEQLSELQRRKNRQQQGQ
ncbi:MAG: MgtE intracellular region [Synergistaceae bacterium]|jgi:flagellar motility protein MotE (MotC chaperone)|nr:MgtE intracellular region [Synergistaceae bacterium]